MIKKITIQNFRGIKELKDFELRNLSLLIGENGTSKTSILEAINFCLSPYFISGRIKHTDFYRGEDVEIKIILEFDQIFTVDLPDGYTQQTIECNKVCLEINKRDRATSNKPFSDIAVVEHYVLPKEGKIDDKGWEKKRDTGTKFKFQQHHLSLPLKNLQGLPTSFYFPRNRGKELQQGFKSTISSVFDDFNWRFNKELRKIETKENFSGEKFITQKNNFERIIVEKIDRTSQEKTFQKLNEKLETLGLQKADISFIDCNAPFNTAFLSQKLDSLDLPISQLGSGIEMIVSILFLETMAEISKENILILIDEPELHLHPELQNKLINHIVSISDKNQFLFATHSPLFVKQTLNNDNTKKQIHCLEKRTEGEVKILELEERVFTSYVSANEINFIAFGLATEEYHSELYNELENKFWTSVAKEQNPEDTGICHGSQKDFDNQFFHKEHKEPLNSPLKGNPNKVTIHTYIRNKIHHSRENSGPPTEEELKESIKKMREIYFSQNSTISL